MTTEQRAKRIKQTLQQAEIMRASHAARLVDAKDNAGKNHIAQLNAQKVKLQEQIAQVEQRISAIESDNATSLVAQLTVEKMRQENRVKEQVFELLQTADDKTAVLKELGDDAKIVEDLVA